MKYLITICGKWTDDFKSKFQSFIKYVPFDLKDCDIIVASDKEQNIEWLKCSNLTQVSVIDDCDHIFYHSEWEQHSRNIFSYKCLEYANHIKNKIELEKLELYDVCFFVDANNIDIIKFPKEFVNPYNRGVVTFNPRKLTIRNDGKNPRPHIYGEVVVVTNSLWYCNSMEFNIISKFYKGNHYYPEHTDFLQVHNLQVFKQIENYYDFFLYYYIRKLEFNFIYAE